MSDVIERIAIELARATDGATAWRATEVIDLARDSARHGVRAVAFGGEPLAFAGVLDVLEALRGVVDRSLTTDGRLLDGQLAPLVRAAPDAVWVVLHQPGHPPEVARVIRQVGALQAVGIASSLAVVVRASRVDDALRTAAHAREAGIDDERIMYLPAPDDSPPPARATARADDTPLARASASRACSAACMARPRVAALGWDKHAAWCPHTRSPRPLAAPTHVALVAALAALGLEPEQRHVAH